MQSRISRFLAGLSLALVVALGVARAGMSYVFSHGHGVQSQTAMTNYEESYEFDVVWGYSAPMVGWGSQPFSYGYLLTVYVDTDYAVGTYYNCAHLYNGSPVDIYIY